MESDKDKEGTITGNKPSDNKTDATSTVNSTNGIFLLCLMILASSSLYILKKTKKS